MIRARFKVPCEDYRPVVWPIDHPYWCSGVIPSDDDGENTSVVVAYADDKDELLRNWPDAQDIDHETADAYLFTSRFPKPDWFTIPGASDDSTGGAA